MNLFKRITAGMLLSAVAVSSAASVFPQTVSEQLALPAAAASTVNNPLIWSDVPDCDVIRVGDTYYMVSTTMYFSPGAPIMKSNDLVTWETCGYVYDRLAEGDGENLKSGKHDYSKGQWAASLRYNEKNGKFYVFFGSYSTGKSYIYSTDDIEGGEWNKVELNGMYHDASILFDDDGRNYLVSGSGGTCSIKEFNSDMTGWQSGGLDKQLFKTNFDNLAGEGWHIQKINGYYYIFGIAWPSGHGRLEFVYRSKSLTGTWESKTILDSGVGTYGSGTAQGGIVETPDGQWYGMLFQDHGAVGRIPSLVPVTWQDDWPMMGVNGKTPVTLNISPSGTTDLAGDDSFDYSSDDLALEWQWNHNPDNSAWSVTERDGWLRLKNKNIATNLLDARNTLTMRTEGPACSSYIKLDTSNMKAGDYAGLSAFQFKYGCIGVYVADNGAKKVYMSTNGGGEIATSSNKIEAEQNMTGDEIYLKVDFKFNTVNSDMSSSNNIDKANFYYSYDGDSWTKLGSELSMSYDLKLFTGYRSGIYSYPTKSTGGYADIDFFEYDRLTWNGANGSKILSGSPASSGPDDNGYFFHNTFESSTESWTGRGAAEVSTSSTKSFEGSKSVYVSGRTASWNGVVRSLGSKFKAGTKYSFSTNVLYTDGPDSQLFYLTLQYKGTDGEVYYDKVARGTAVKGEWIQLANTAYEIPAGATDLQLYVETDSGTSSFYIDDAYGAVEGTVIAGAGVAPVITPGDVSCDGVINAVDIALARQGITHGFASAYGKIAADADQNGEVEINDVVLIQEYVLGIISEFPVYQPPKPAFNYDSAVSYHEPSNGENYLDRIAEAGTVTKEYYNGINGQKALNVYTPYGYDPSKKYNIFYLMHGGGENENTCFSDDVKMQNILDHMIKNGEIEPMIVVCPTFNGCPNTDGNAGAGTVWDEMRQSIIPFVESKYSTYAENTTIDGLRASRFHRAYGGFSMGSGSTWNNFCNNLDIIAYFMPLSGHCWLGAQGIQNAIDASGFTQRDYFVFAATGDDDLAYGNMMTLMPTLQADTKRFTYTSDFSQGNLYFLVAPGKTHWWGVVRWYVYDALPYFFHEGT